MHTATKLLRVILYAKYEKVDLHKVIENQCQHSTIIQRNELLRILHTFEELLYGTLGSWKHPVEFELKQNVKPIYSRSYPVLKVHKEMLKIG